MNRTLGWTFGVIAALMALVYWLLPSRLWWLDLAAGAGYAAAAVLLIPPPRLWFLQRVVKTEWTNDVLLGWIFICVGVGAGCAYLTRYV